MEVVVSEIGMVSIFHLPEAWENADHLYQELRTDSGGPVWREDNPVHLTMEAYSEVAGKILMRCGSDDGDPPAKHRRLERVVTGQRGSLPRGRAIRPTPWVTGQRGSLPRGRAIRPTPWVTGLEAGMGRG